MHVARAERLRDVGVAVRARNGQVIRMRFSIGLDRRVDTLRERDRGRILENDDVMERAIAAAVMASARPILSRASNVTPLRARAHEQTPAAAKRIRITCSSGGWLRASCRLRSRALPVWSPRRALSTSLSRRPFRPGRDQ